MDYTKLKTKGLTKPITNARVELPEKPYQGNPDHMTQNGVALWIFNNFSVYYDRTRETWEFGKTSTIFCQYEMQREIQLILNNYITVNYSFSFVKGVMSLLRNMAGSYAFEDFDRRESDIENWRV